MEYEVLLKHLAKPAIKESMPLFKKLKDKIHHTFNDGILDYFDASLDKYKEIKTLLHRQPTSFYNIFYHTALFDKSEGTDISSESVKGLFKDTNFITIIGDAGSGKSTLLKHLFISSFVEYYKAPIFVNLRDLNVQNSNLEQYIRENILDNKLSPSADFLDGLFKSGEFLFFLDGYDEINSTDKHEITKNLERFIDKYPKNKFLLTSRPYSNIEFFKNFRNLHIKDMNQNEQIVFIEQQIKDTRLSAKIIESIKDTPEAYIASFFKNALLLTLYIMAYSKNSSIPNKKYIFYMRVFDVLYAEHDSATKIGFEREIKTQLNQESLEAILKTFCFLSYFDSFFDFKKDYIFDQLTLIKDKAGYKFKNNDFIDDMKMSIGLWQEDCGIYSFAHRSMQEFFAAIYLTKLKNIQNKKKVYEKICDRANKLNFNMANFLSLCNEMDEDFFIENYSFPMLEKLRKLLVSNDGVYNLSFEYIKNGIFADINSNKTEKYNLSYGVSDNTLFVANAYITNDLHLSFLNRIANKLFDNKEHELFSQFFSNKRQINQKNNKTKNKKIKNNRNGIFIKNDNNPNDFKAFLIEIGVIKLMDEIVAEIDGCKHQLALNIANEKSVETDFVDMI